jgi:hypothetical protein
MIICRSWFSFALAAACFSAGVLAGAGCPAGTDVLDFSTPFCFFGSSSSLEELLELLLDELLAILMDWLLKEVGNLAQRK